MKYFFLVVVLSSLCLSTFSIYSAETLEGAPRKGEIRDEVAWVCLELEDARAYPLSMLEYKRKGQDSIAWSLYMTDIYIMSDKCNHTRIQYRVLDIIETIDGFNAESDGSFPFPTRYYIIRAGDPENKKKKVYYLASYQTLGEFGKAFLLED